jgi:peptidyl-prolyl isomerase E (cyclophilin E)
MAEPGRARRTLYVGGLAEEVDIKTLTAAFLPFGEIVDVQIPMDIALSEQPWGHAAVSRSTKSTLRPIRHVGNRATCGLAQDSSTTFDRPTHSATPDKNRGFGFVELAEEGDAQDALENMEGSELFGRTLRVTVARPMQKKNAAVWQEAEDWFKSLKEGEEQPAGEAEPAGS